MGGRVSAVSAAVVWMCAASASAQATLDLDAPATSEVDEAVRADVDVDIEVDVEAEADAPAGDDGGEPSLESLVVPPAPDLESDQLRLGALLETQALEEEQGTVWSGFVSMGLGALQLGAGLWLAFDDGTFASLDTLRWTTVALSIPLGVLSVVSGVVGMTQQGVRGDRLRRWRLAMDGQLDARQLGRFEGELRAEAETARILRGFEVAAGFGTTGGGAALMLVTALSNPDAFGEAYGYGVGGALMAAGLISGLIALFSESDAEQTWRRYLDGEGPPGEPDGVDLSVAPSVSEDGFGLSLQGRF